MGDLCQNCGDCHLGSHPVPCKKDLVECIICYNYGHQFIFCPKSVKIADKSFEYFMICHNCDEWHLPRPCQHDFVHCNRCNNYGHLPHFCPSNPIQRGQDPNYSLHAVNVSQIHPELLRKIQVDVCTDVLRLLEKHSKEQVLAFLSRPILPSLQTAVATAPSHIPILPAPSQQPPADVHAHHRQHSNAGHPPPIVAYDSPFDHQQVRQEFKPDDPKTSLSIPPTPNSPLGHRKVPNLGASTRLVKLEEGDIVQNEGSQQQAGGKAKGKKASVTKDKVTKSKAPRRAPQPRCADCKKRHKRCEHGLNALTDDDVFGSQSPQPVQTPDTRTRAVNDVNSPFGTPGPTEDTPSALVRLPVSQSGQYASGAQTHFNAQGAHVEPMSRDQQEALRSAAAAMPALVPDVHLQHGSQYQGHVGQIRWMQDSAQQAMAGYLAQGTQPPVAETTNANTLPPIMSSFFDQEDPHVAAHRPQTHVLESNGHAFVHTDRQMMQGSSNTSTLRPNHMMKQDPGFMSSGNQRVITPNHHNSDREIYSFGESGQVINSVEEEASQHTAAKAEGLAEVEQVEGAESAEASQGSAGGRKPEDDEMLVETA